MLSATLPTPRFANLAPGSGVSLRSPGTRVSVLKNHDHHLRRHHPRCRTQRPHPAGLSRQGRPQDAGDRSPPGRGRRIEHAGRPAPSRLPAQHPRLLPARHHRDAVVRRSRARTARRPLHRARAQRRAAHRRRTRAGMVDRSAQDDRIVRRLQPPRRRHVAALARRVRADRARYSGARGPLAAAAAAGAPRAAGDAPAPAGGCSR